MSKISVIVPVYKVENYLARCVDSILAQTFKDYELILVDDGSPDNCPKICDEYAAKYDFIKVIHKENGGLSDARNFGIEYALTTDSEWLTFIDSDDWVHPQYLELLYNTAIKYNIEICSCNLLYKVKEEPRYYDFYKEKDIKVLVNNIEFLVDRKMNTASACGRLYRKNCFLEIRFPVGKLFEDMRTIYKVLYNPNWKSAYVYNKLYYYFYNENGIAFSKYTIQKSIDEISAVEEHLMFLYKNNYFTSLKYRYAHYRKLVESLIKNYSEEEVRKVQERYFDIKEELRKNVKNIDLVYMRDRKIKNCREKKIMVINLKQDCKILMKEKNIFFAVLFYIKNFWKVYFGK